MMTTTNDTSKSDNQKSTKTKTISCFDWLDDMTRNKSAIRLHKKKKNYKNRPR